MKSSNATEPSEQVTIIAALGTHCRRRLAAKLKFDYGSNVTERRGAVTKIAAPGTNCHRALRTKLKFGGIMIDEPGKKMV